MTVRFARLRIAGFKSFADPVTVEILPGLTGIVGPNGCGKSNVVEALRWVMGESSARSLRGGEMDDLIFAGTTGRPARSLAEVTITLEGTKGFGPANVADLDELQISRRAERGAGSDYRINGRPARARDVQTLFADLASGARSSAMVSQGRVAMLVGARPEERRTILEEAAGITGLHARRHEAELKLRATETNLTRAEDRRLQLTDRLGALAEQSREATRYRELSAALREAEVELLALLHARARLAVERAHAQAAQARSGLSAHEAAAEDAVVAEFEATKALPALREKADAARTALERCRILAESLAREEERATTQAQDAAKRLAQHEADAQAAQTRLADAQTALERLKAEQAEIEDSLANLPQRLRDAGAQQDALSTELEQIERALADQTQTIATARERKDRAAESLQAARLRHERATSALAAAEEELATLSARLPTPEAIETARQAAEARTLEAETARATLESAERLRAQCQAELTIAQNTAEAARTAQNEQRQALNQARQRVATLTQELEQADKRHAQAQGALVDQTAMLALREEEANAAQNLQRLTQALDQAEHERLLASTAFAEASRTAQEAQARQRSTAEALRVAQAALHRAEQEETTLAEELAQARAEAMDGAVLEQARADRVAQENALAEIGQALEQTQGTLSASRVSLQEATARQNAVQTELTRLQAQAEGLDHALGAEDTAADDPVSVHITVAEEYETALASALADGLDAPASENAARGWRQLATGTIPTWPEGVLPLSAVVSAPPALDRVLAFTGLLPAQADGTGLQKALAPGQILVSRSGDIWRWDGFYAHAGGASPAARKLAQRRVLRETRARIQSLQDEAPTYEHALAQATQAVGNAEQHIETLRSRRDAVEVLLQQARAHETGLERRFAASRARLDTTLPQHERAVAAKAEAQAALDRATEALAALPSVDAAQAALEAARARNTSAETTQRDAHNQLKQAQVAMSGVRERVTQAEQQHASATTRLDTLTPERERLRQILDAEKTMAAELEQRLASAQAAQQAELALQDAQAALSAAQTALQAAEEAVRRTRQDAEAATRHNQQVQDEALGVRSRLEGLTPRLHDLQAQLAESETLLAEATAAWDNAASALPADAQEQLDALRHKRTQCSAALDTAREHKMGLQAQSTTLASRQDTVATAMGEWATRADTAATEMQDAGLRLETARAEHDSLAHMPATAEREKREMLQALAEAEQQHAQADAARNAGESALAAANEQRRKADGELATAREAVLKAESKSEQARAILDQLLAESPAPARPPSSDLTEAAESSLRRKIGRLTRERDDMGPVNLRAELEAQEASTQAQTLASEMADLEAGIARLRGSIGGLNKEGRERLMAVFTQVDQHFQSLFTRMFGGGRAHLGLVGSDDPLEAGLEIYAQPPGKKLATLSLLSGGEQALTALSLIFAVFRCNPAPICVLDEVDAPLDDANVGRFSALLGDMVTEAGTRFLVVTHHQLTMAHMDQLFGVTMQERGVSRVLSVDLARAASMVGQKDKEAPNVAS
ncbi:AAA family ATPase [Acetobacter sp. TBRC 12305]|uniref:Chromosome partition protein Smc n=1 Tax=Acetobacter garciniae TaxID=2817435 RepID=A0A939HM31_9PROT|nr:AAA family ATPase [Acetobacter garciniae]MBO1324063.1 AAA family ATPase [Acetobacter garciniae]MBX0343752.1 AAA family ATPase [Acetobacter garciniae]